MIMKIFNINTNTLTDTVNSISGLIKTVIIAVIIIALLIGVKKIAFPSFHLFGSNPLTIEKTNNVVSEIKKISEFTTACFYEEKALVGEQYRMKETPVYKITASDNKLMGILEIPKKKLDGTIVDSVLSAKIAYITHGIVRAGYDLSKISDEGFIISSDTITIHLPQAEIFDVIVNPSDMELFDRFGNWSEEQTTAIESKAKDEIRQDAIEYGILDKAVSSGKPKLESLFKTFGFNVVILVD